MALPPTAMAVAWLTERGVSNTAVRLAATGGQPQEALEWAAQGLDAALWQRLPALVQPFEFPILCGDARGPDRCQRRQPRLRVSGREVRRLEPGRRRVRQQRRHLESG